MIPFAMSLMIGISDAVKYEANWTGNSRMLTAKMIGMTPAWLTRNGRNVAPPWYMRRPRTRLAYWMGMRRWPSWMNTMAATTTIAKMMKATPPAMSGFDM